MKLSLVLSSLPASIFTSACAAATPSPPPVVPVAQLQEAAPVTKPYACGAPEHAEAPAINVTVQAPAGRAVDPTLAATLRRLPPFEQTALVTPASLKMIDGKLRVHGRNNHAQVEVSVPSLTTQCEQTVQTAIQAQRPVELQGKGRAMSDHIPGHGYISAFDLEDVTSCVAR
jgi:hypothetical protein